MAKTVANADVDLDTTSSLPQRVTAELFGTFLLVSGVVGTALFAGNSVGILGIALAVGLTVVAGAYAVGHISGGHFNPAVTVGLLTAGRFDARDLIPYVIAPFFGQTPFTYHAHHVGMHHTENNLEPDESSTMPYQRDSVRGFLHYYLRFLFTGIATLAAYLFRKKRNKLMIGVIRGEFLFLAFCFAMCFVNLPATLIVFIIPFLIFRLVAMAGNWVQHTFVCPDEPGNHFRNSITCINVKFNHRCWNDGYHISHHIDPTMHWTEHPKYFREHLKDFADNEAVVFAGLNYMDVFFRLMKKRYDLLAEHFVDIDGRYANDAEVIAMLQRRTAPITVTEKGSSAQALAA